MKIISRVLFLITVLFSSSTFAMTDIRGKTADLTEYIGKGQWLIVEAWHSECGVCMSNMPKMVQSIGTYPNAKVIGVSLDGNKNKAKTVIDKFRINFPTFVSNISEFDKYIRKISNKKLKGAPTYLIFTPQGKLAAMQSGNITPEEIRSYIKSH